MCRRPSRPNQFGLASPTGPTGRPIWSTVLRCWPFAVVGAVVVEQSWLVVVLETVIQPPFVVDRAVDLVVVTMARVPSPRRIP